MESGLVGSLVVSKVNNALKTRRLERDDASRRTKGSFELPARKTSTGNLLENFASPLKVFRLR